MTHTPLIALFFMASSLLLLWLCCGLARRLSRDRATLRRLRQKRRENAHTIRTLNAYLAAYMGAVERLQQDAEPRPRYVDDKGELVH
jgi:type VI protein secretion system component VasK